MALTARYTAIMPALFTHLADRLLPAACVLCGAEAVGRRLCVRCQPLIPLNTQACARWAAPLPAPAPRCGECLGREPAFDAALAACRYEPPLDRLVQKYKYAEGLAVARALAPLLADRVQACGSRPDGLLPIPLHRTRLRQRGYNQALVLAMELARLLGLPVLGDGLDRTRATTAQAGLEADERRRNVRGAFAARPGLPTHMALIDDVMTTGSTLDEAARTLKAAGVTRVQAWVLARRP
jgi:ComF family protein